MTDDDKPDTNPEDDCCFGEPGRSGPSDYHDFDCPVYLANVAAIQRRLNRGRAT